MDVVKLRNAVFGGLKDACEYSIDFNQYFYPDIKPEYLITVCVAQSLLANFNTEIIIKIEEPTREFKRQSSDIGDLMRYFNHINNFILRREGRVDIGIHNKERQSICPIEIKGFNQTPNLIISDIERLIDFLSYNQKNNSIEIGVLAFLEEHKKCFIDTNKDDGLKKIKEKYEKLINNNFRTHYMYLDFSVEVDTSYESLFTDEEFESIDPDYYDEFLREKVHYVGVVLTIQKKKPNQIR